jgi:itaconate CoA-transferase
VSQPGPHTAHLTTHTSPLEGIRVVAWEHAVAAPLATRHLADLGADVIKIERPSGGDFARGYDSAVNGLSAHFVWLNRGKRSVVLDLQAEGDRRALELLAERADVFVHNQGPGAADRMGLGYEQLRKANPRLVWCAISGFGPNGPHADRKAYDMLLQGEAGVIALTGTPEAPAKVGISVADIASGMYALSSIMAALYQRQATGRGAEIQISMLEALVEWITPAAYFSMYAGNAPVRSGGRHSTIVPYGAYAVGGSASVNLAVQNDGQWRRLCAVVLQQPALADAARFATNELRLAHRDELEPLIESLLANTTRQEVEARLAQADVPFGSINDIQQVVEHPQLVARGRWFDVPSAVGPVRALHHPFNIAGIPRPAGAVPELGQHTDQVLAELGVSRAM